MACIERRVQRFFAPTPPNWSDAHALDALDAAVLRRLRYIALCPVGVAVWFVASFALGGPSPTRVGTLLGSVVQAAVMLTARAHPLICFNLRQVLDAQVSRPADRLRACSAAKATSRSLAGVTQLAHFFTLFLMFTLSSLPVMTLMTSQRCDMLHTRMHGPATTCTLLMWDLFFASLLPAGTVRPTPQSPSRKVSLDRMGRAGLGFQITALQSARRLELSLLLHTAHGGDCDDDAAPRKGDAATGAAAGQQPGASTRRAAGLMAAPRAEVIATPRDGAGEAAGREGLWLNPLFGDAPSGPELQGILINTGGPQPPAPRVSIRIDAAAPQAPRLSRKLTR